jgi:hypothetical protein
LFHLLTADCNHQGCSLSSLSMYNLRFVSDEVLSAHSRFIMLEAGKKKSRVTFPSSFF